MSVQTPPECIFWCSSNNSLSELSWGRRTARVIIDGSENAPDMPSVVSAGVVAEHAALIIRVSIHVAHSIATHGLGSKLLVQ